VDPEGRHTNGGEGLLDDNVVRLPRDWLGPRDELIPIGPISDKSAPPPTADDFWGESSALVQDALSAPMGTAVGGLAADDGAGPVEVADDEAATAAEVESVRAGAPVGACAARPENSGVRAGTLGDFGRIAHKIPQRPWGRRRLAALLGGLAAVGAGLTLVIQAGPGPPGVSRSAGDLRANASPAEHRLPSSWRGIETHARMTRRGDHRRPAVVGRPARKTVVQVRYVSSSQPSSGSSTGSVATPTQSASSSTSSASSSVASTTAGASSSDSSSQTSGSGTHPALGANGALAPGSSPDG
jgi:hypothetical protein